MPLTCSRPAACAGLKHTAAHPRDSLRAPTPSTRNNNSWQGPALAKSLAFPKHIEAAAAAVIAALAPLSSGGEFWGVHLRLEEDFKQIDWYRGRRKVGLGLGWRASACAPNCRVR